MNVQESISRVSNLGTTLLIQTLDINQRVTPNNVLSQAAYVEATILDFKNSMGAVHFNTIFVPQMKAIIERMGIQYDILDTSELDTPRQLNIPTRGQEVLASAPVVPNGTVTVMVAFIDGNMKSIGTAEVAVVTDPAAFMASLIAAIPEDIKLRTSRLWLSQGGKMMAIYSFDRVNNTLARV